MVLRLVLVICPLTGHSFFHRASFFFAFLFQPRLFLIIDFLFLVASTHSPLHISFTDNDCFFVSD